MRRFRWWYFWVGTTDQWWPLGGQEWSKNGNSLKYFMLHIIWTQILYWIQKWYSYKHSQWFWWLIMTTEWSGVVKNGNSLKYFMLHIIWTQMLYWIQKWYFYEDSHPFQWLMMTSWWSFMVKNKNLESKWLVMQFTYDILKCLIELWYFISLSRFKV